MAKHVDAKEYFPARDIGNYSDHRLFGDLAVGLFENQVRPGITLESWDHPVLHRGFLDDFNDELAN